MGRRMAPIQLLATSPGSYREVGVWGDEKFDVRSGTSCSLAKGFSPPYSRQATASLRARMGCGYEVMLASSSCRLAGRLCRTTIGCIWHGMQPLSASLAGTLKFSSFGRERAQQTMYINNNQKYINRVNAFFRLTL